MSRLEDDEILDTLINIKLKNKLSIEFNVLDYITNDTLSKEELAIYFISRTQGHGILVEVVKGNIIVSLAITNNGMGNFLNEDGTVDIEKVLNSLPVRFKEVISRIKLLKKDNNKPVTKDFIDEIIKIATEGVKKNKICTKFNHDFLYSTIVINFDRLLHSDKTMIIYKKE